MSRLVPIALAALCACTAEVTNPGGDADNGPVLMSLALVPASLFLTAGRTSQLTAQGTLTDESVEDMTASVVWRSSNEGVVTVAGGLVDAQAAGTEVVTAEHPATGMTAICDVQVAAGEVTGVVVTPATVSIAYGRTQALTATATLSDGSTPDVTTAAIWGSTNTDVVTVTAAGVIEAVGEGEADVEATLDGRTGGADITVTPPEVDTIALVPPSVEIPVGRSANVEAHATLTDGSGPIDVTTQTVWESSLSSVARIDDAGLVAGVAEGEATLTVTFVATGAEGTAPVTVVTAELDHIDVAPVDATVGLERYTTYTATGVYSDDSTEELTTGIDWDTLDHEIATIDASGELYGVAWGATAVSATHVATSIVGSTGVTVAYAAEGTTDVPVAITPPYEGQVDTTSSYYVVSGLTPSSTYTVSVDGNDDVDLFVYEDLFVTRACSSSTFGGQDSCDAMAPANGTLYIEIRGFGATTNPGALFTITLSAGVASPDLIIELTAVSGNGSLVTFNYTITNDGPGTFAGGLVNVSFWPNASAPPGPTTMGPGINVANVPVLAPTETHEGSSFTGSSVTSGTAYGNVDYTNAVLETDDDNNVSPAFDW